MANDEALAEAPRVSLAEAKRLFDARQAIFIDVRSRDAYEQAHIPGAIAMPLREVPQRDAELPRDRQLVFY